MATSRTPAMPPLTARHLWLAGLGLVAIARREALARGERVAAQMSQARRRAAAAVDAIPTTVRSAFGRAEPAAMQLAGTLESRLSPVLARIGLAAKPAARKPAGVGSGARRTTTRRTARKKP